MPSRYEESILTSLRRMTRAIDLHSKKLASHYQLTGPQLVCLRCIDREEITTPSEVAAGVSLSQGTVTGILDRLERRRLITRSRSDEDKRKIVVRLTTAGQNLIVAAPSPLHEQFSARLSTLHEGEQAMIDWVLQRVVSMMEAERVDAAPMFTTGRIDAEFDDVAEFLDPQRSDDE